MVAPSGVLPAERWPATHCRRPACAALLENGDRPDIVGERGRAGQRRRRCGLRRDVERAGRGMEGALNLALAGVAAHLGLELQARPESCPVRAITAILR